MLNILTKYHTFLFYRPICIKQEPQRNDGIIKNARQHFPQPMTTSSHLVVFQANCAKPQWLTSEGRKKTENIKMPGMMKAANFARGFSIHPASGSARAQVK